MATETRPKEVSLCGTCGLSGEVYLVSVTKSHDRVSGSKIHGNRMSGAAVSSDGC